MADEYTPTTEDVKCHYALRRMAHTGMQHADAECDRTTKAEALREAVAYARPVDGDHVGTSRDEAIGFEEALQLVIDYAAGIGDDPSFLAFRHVSSVDEKTNPGAGR